MSRKERKEKKVGEDSRVGSGVETEDEVERRKVKVKERGVVEKRVVTRASRRKEEVKRRKGLKGKGQKQKWLERTDEEEEERRERASSTVEVDFPSWLRSATSVLSRPGPVTSFRALSALNTFVGQVPDLDIARVVVLSSRESSWRPPRLARRR